VSVRSAKDDNTQYFDKVYSDVAWRPIENRYRQFETFEHIPSVFHTKEGEIFDSVIDRMPKSRSGLRENYFTGP